MAGESSFVILVLLALGAFWMSGRGGPPSEKEAAGKRHRVRSGSCPDVVLAMSARVEDAAVTRRPDTMMERELRAQ